MNILSKKKPLVIGICVLIVIAAVFLGFMLSNRDQAVAAGQFVVVTVTADALDDVYGYQFNMQYNKDELEYTDSITSLTDIKTIFSKDMGTHELVGATMVGEQNGISGKNKAMCQMVFTAKKDINLSDVDLSISKVNTVKSDLEYIENIEGWRLKAKVQE